MSKLNRDIFSKILLVAGFNGSAERQFTEFSDYFRTEHTAAEVNARFAAFVTPECIRSFKALGHYGTNALTTTGLCRWLLQHFGIDVKSRKVGGRENRQQAYQIENIAALDYVISRASDYLSDGKPAIPTSANSRHGYVYLLKAIHDSSLVKIGRTKDPNNRLKTFNVKMPFQIEYEIVIKTDDMYKLESNLHNQYKKSRINGEWFRLTNTDLINIKGCYS